MKLSLKSEYACLALIDLAEHTKQEIIKIEEIARRKGIPKKFLEQILLSLKNAGFVKSRRGPDGGYQLARPADKIFLAEIIRLMDGPLAPVESVSVYFYDNSPIEQSPALIAVFKDIRDYIAEKLEHTSFADLVK
ncbi:MAG TPA: Rrf2 family transcriptional regulator [Spirochaetota bacterium]|nr:Rrf2 family transcriptional regulator [Spirochaetota bacterium]HPI90846.1 Rrf2 family transcriptional regulator [Spirochaetota bacterium]HPR49873.1 Rrf2 family transcriptional regulator [Spirochaetota bacterium]